MDMEKIRAAMLVAPMGHDVDRISGQFETWIEKSGVFEVKRAGVFSGSQMSIREFLTDASNVDGQKFFYCFVPENILMMRPRRS